MKTYSIVLLLFVTVLLLASCKSADDPEDGSSPAPDIGDETPVYLESYEFDGDNFPRFDGSPAMQPLAGALSGALTGRERDDTGHLAAFSATARAFRNLAGGLCDIILISEPYPPVLDELAAMDFRYDMAPVAIDALVFIVSESNPVDNLTAQQVRDIYSGTLTDWQQAGGLDIDILAFQRSKEAASQVLAEMLVMDSTTMANAPLQAILSGLFLYGDDPVPVVVKGFDSSINAIGYTMFYYAANMGMADGYKILSVDGVLPSKESIADGSYPYTAPYYAVIGRNLPEDDGARIIYNWLLSDSGQEFIAGEGYVSMLEADAKGGARRGAVPQMRWDVTADAAALTAYNFPKSRFERLRGGALPYLEPSGSYGPVFPYSAAATLDDGSIFPVKYGLAAVSGGLVITDPVYDNIERAVCSLQTGDIPLAAYRLHINLPEDSPGFGFRTLQAACADDGSWVTPHIYENIVFRTDVFFCQNDYFGSTFDIDVYDYGGNLLYNILDLDWASKISEFAWPEYLMYGASGGYGFIQLDDDSYALMNVLTGTIAETDFLQAGIFSGSLAAVVPGGSGNPGGLWGFVNTSLELVIPAQYTREAVFAGGRAIVETPDGAGHIIDSSGNVLFSVPPGNLIVDSGGYGYTIYPLSSGGLSNPQFLTYSFDEIEYPPEAFPSGPESSAYFLRQGWVFCSTENGSYIFNPERSYRLPEPVQQVTDFFFYDSGGPGSNGYVIFTQHDSASGQQRSGVISLDGDVIIPPAAGQRISFVFMAGSPPWFAVNTAAPGSGTSGFTGDLYMQTEYKLIDPGGQTSMSGIGILSYDAATGYLYVLGGDYFALFGSDFNSGGGNVLFAIPSMAYSFD